jgi:hypothetical protein
MERNSPGAPRRPAAHWIMMQSSRAARFTMCASAALGRSITGSAAFGRASLSTCGDVHSARNAILMIQQELAFWRDFLELLDGSHARPLPQRPSAAASLAPAASVRLRPRWHLRRQKRIPNDSYTTEGTCLLMRISRASCSPAPPAVLRFRTADARIMITLSSSLAAPRTWSPPWKHPDHWYEGVVSWSNGQTRAAPERRRAPIERSTVAACSPAIRKRRQLQLVLSSSRAGS